MTQTPAPSTQKSQRTRAALLDAARVLLGNQGIDAVDVRALCRLADVGRTSFYTYFKGADEIIAEVSKQEINRFKAGFEGLHGGLPRGMERLELCIQMIFNYSADAPGSALFLTSFASTDPSVANMIVEEVEAELRGAAELAIDDETRQALARFITQSLLGTARQIAKGEIATDHIAQQLRFTLAPCALFRMP